MCGRGAYKTPMKYGGKTSPDKHTSPLVGVIAWDRWIDGWIDE